MMRSILCLAVVGILAGAPLAAQASVDSCAQALLQSPTDALGAGLELTPGQTSQLGWIRDTMNRRRAVLQSNLNQVRLELDPSSGYSVDSARLELLQRQEAELAQQLDRELLLATSRAAAVLTEWQRERCELDDPEAMAAVSPLPSPIVEVAPPVPEAVPLPVPVAAAVVRMPRVVVARPWRGRAPVIVRRPAPAYGAPVIVPHPHPVYRAPLGTRWPLPAYRAPLSTRWPRPAYRAPAPVYAPRAPVFRPAPGRAPSSGWHHGRSA